MSIRLKFTLDIKKTIIATQRRIIQILGINMHDLQTKRWEK